MLIAAALALLAFYIIFENIYVFVTKKTICIKNIPKELENKRIAFISDVHINESGKLGFRASKRIEELSPDIIFVSGDFVSRHIMDLKNAKDVMQKLCKIAPVYLSIGNHELDLNETLYKEFLQMANSCGAIVLDDKQVKISDDLYILGATIKKGCYRNENGGYSNLLDYTLSDMKSALGEKKGFSVVLAHNPFFFDTYEKWGADIVLSGHVHGGSFRLPFLCGILSPERKFFPKYSSGLYKKNSCIMFVSRGLAKPRIFCPKHVVLLKFSKCE